MTFQNDLASAFMENVHYQLSPVTVVREEYVEQWRRTPWGPGCIKTLPSCEQGKDYNFVQPPSTTNESLNVLTWLTNQMTRTTGAKDELAGITNQRSASGIKMLQESAQGRTVDIRLRAYAVPLHTLYMSLYKLNRYKLEGEQMVKLPLRGQQAFTRSGPEDFQEDVLVDVLLPEDMLPPELKQNRALGLWSALAGHPRADQDKLLINLARAFGWADPSSILTDPARVMADVQEEFIDFQQTGFLPPVRPGDPHHLIIQLYGGYLTTSAGELSEGSVLAIQSFLQKHQLMLQQEQAAQAAQAQGMPGMPGEGGGNVDPGVQEAANVNTEATFMNGMTGAQQNP
jgi:hypothetical protein